MAALIKADNERKIDTDVQGLYFLFRYQTPHMPVAGAAEHTVIRSLKLTQCEATLACAGADTDGCFGVYMHA